MVKHLSIVVKHEFKHSHSVSLSPGVKQSGIDIHQSFPQRKFRPVRDVAKAFTLIISNIKSKTSINIIQLAQAFCVISYLFGELPESHRLYFIYFCFSRIIAQNIVFNVYIS